MVSSVYVPSEGFFFNWGHVKTSGFAKGSVNIIFFCYVQSLVFCLPSGDILLSLFAKKATINFGCVFPSLFHCLVPHNGPKMPFFPSFSRRKNGGKCRQKTRHPPYFIFKGSWNSQRAGAPEKIKKLPRKSPAKWTSLNLAFRNAPCMHTVTVLIDFVSYQRVSSLSQKRYQTPGPRVSESRQDWETDVYTPPVLGGAARYDNSAPAVYKILSPKATEFNTPLALNL